MTAILAGQRFDGADLHGNACDPHGRESIRECFKRKMGKERDMVRRGTCFLDDGSDEDALVSEADLIPYRLQLLEFPQC
jgi:hypothetical protein